MEKETEIQIQVLQTTAWWKKLLYFYIYQVISAFLTSDSRKSTNVINNINDGFDGSFFGKLYM